MKKDEFSSNIIRPKYVPTYKPAFDVIPERITPKLVSKVNPVPKATSPTTTSNVTQKPTRVLVPQFHSGDIRAFESIQDAKIAFDRYIYDNDIKLDFSAEKGFDYRTVFQAIILCKFLSTVKWLFKDFRKLYNINFSIKLLWKRTTWHATYNKPAFTFNIVTGSNGNGTLQSGTYNNQNIYMFEPLSYAISDYIYKAQYSVPKSRMDEYLIILSELSKLRKVGDIDICMLP